MFSDAGSGQTAVFATFAPVVKSIEFDDVACGAETRPGWAARTSLARTVKWKTSWSQSSLVPRARRRRNPYIDLAQ